MLPEVYFTGSFDKFLPLIFFNLFLNNNNNNKKENREA